jgi:hypothetical protein
MKNDEPNDHRLPTSLDGKDNDKDHSDRLGIGAPDDPDSAVRSHAVVRAEEGSGPKPKRGPLRKKSKVASQSPRSDEDAKFEFDPYIFCLILFGLLVGLAAATLSTTFPQGSKLGVVIFSLGSGLISTSLIGLTLEVLSGKRLKRKMDKLVKPYLRELHRSIGVQDAIREHGLRCCHGSRTEALESFFGHAEDVVRENDKPKSKRGGQQSPETIDIVSSSALGLIGSFDGAPADVFHRWRDLIVRSPDSFRVLLTHPAYGHLRQAAEGSGPGEIEFEILRTAIFLHFIGGLKGDRLRFYRGSPTSFAIRAGQRVLINPYSFGKIGMETLCLEFENDAEPSPVGQFFASHFDEAWHSCERPIKKVDGKFLVEGVRSYTNIVSSFLECLHLNEPTKLRMGRSQLEELDQFVMSGLKEFPYQTVIPTPSEPIFMKAANDRDLSFAFE